MLILLNNTEITEINQEIQKRKGRKKDFVGIIGRDNDI